MNEGADRAMLAVELQLHANRKRRFAAEHDVLNAAHAKALGALIDRLFGAPGKIPPKDGITTARGMIALVHGLALQRPTSKPTRAMRSA